MSLTRPSVFRPNEWSIHSQITGRIRVRCSELIYSSQLRHHCELELTRCHWLKEYRINRLSGDVVLIFPDHRQDDIEELLEGALTLPREDDHLSQAIIQLRLEEWDTKLKRSSSLRNAAFAASILAVDLLFPIPLLIISAASVIALRPLAQEIWEHWRHHRKLSPEILELAFTGVLIGHGHGGEAILDIGLGDASQAIEDLAKNQSEHKERSEEFVERIGTMVSLELQDRDTPSRLLKDAQNGDIYIARPNAHIFLNSTLLEGELIIINRLVDGQWQPFTRRVGDKLPAGSLIIKGTGLLRVDDSILEHDSYLGILQTRSSELGHTSIEEKLERYDAIATPLLLGAGGLTMLFGAFERSLGVLQFNPYNSWATSNISSKFTAIYSLGLHGIHIKAPDALFALSKVKHLVISRSCIDRIGGIKTREILSENSTASPGELLRILAGVQDYLLEADGVRIWSDQLHYMENHAIVIHAELADLRDTGWTITLEDGRKLLIKQQKDSETVIHYTHLDPLEVWEGSKLIGRVELITRPDEGWIGVCEALQDMGITIHIVGVEGQSRMTELIAPLGIRHDANLHGDFEAFDRLELVNDLKRNGDGVAFLGYVLHDLPALTHADVSICLDIDSDSAITGSICDVTLGADVHWLPRLIQLSRNIEKTARSNFILLAGSSLVTAVGAATAIINPLSTVLLSNLPFLISELRNLSAMNSHSVFETTYEKERAIPPLPPKHPKCRIPSGSGHQPATKKPLAKATRTRRKSAESTKQNEQLLNSRDN